MDNKTWIFPQCVSAWECCIRWLLSVAAFPPAGLQQWGWQEEESEKGYAKLLLHLFFRNLSWLLVVCRFDTAEQRGGFIVNAIHRASLGDLGAVLSVIRKTRKEMSQQRNWQHVIHRYIMTVYLTPPLPEPSSATVFPAHSFCPASILHGCSLSMEFPLCFSRPRLFPFPPFKNPTPPVLCLCFSCSPVFLVFSFSFFSVPISVSVPMKLFPIHVRQCQFFTFFSPGFVFNAKFYFQCQNLAVTVPAP